MSDQQRSGRGQLRVAAVQATPAYLDRERTLARVVDHVSKAAADGAQLVVFPESFVPGYPDWLWRSRPFDDGEWYARFHDQAVDVSGRALDAVRAAAQAAEVWVALGITERSRSGAPYNSVVHVDDHGSVAGVHRKLVPTGAERLVWSNGQESLLTVVDTGGVRVGSLICWESYLPLARAAMYAEGIDVLLARPGTTATSGCRPCGTSPRAARCSSSASPPSCGAATSLATFPAPTRCTGERRTTCRAATRRSSDRVARSSRAR